jgi:hypothetical protein
MQEYLKMTKAEFAARLKRFVKAAAAISFRGEHDLANELPPIKELEDLKAAPEAHSNV